MLQHAAAAADACRRMQMRVFGIAGARRRKKKIGGGTHASTELPSGAQFQQKYGTNLLPFF
jgi:hypothetical protein